MTYLDDSNRATNPNPSSVPAPNNWVPTLDGAACKIIQVGDNGAQEH